MTSIEDLKNKVLDGNQISPAQALTLITAPLAELNSAAEEIRQHFCGNRFELCSIINAKSGRCPEDCRFCGQSAHYPTQITEYPLLSPEQILAQAQENERQGAWGFSLVTSGKNLRKTELEQVLQSIRLIRANTQLQICVSLGLLTEAQFRQIKAAGANRVHCNLETSANYFPSICTTHSFQQKIQTLEKVRQAGLDLCSGGILGMGESWEDRIDLALTLQKLQIKSVPLNFLNPIPGTPLANQTLPGEEEKQRIVSIFRFILPDAFLRLAGGRILMPDRGEACFKAGANAAISGHLLTTPGITLEKDLALVQKLGFRVGF